ncbi:MAG: hypothetical protein QF521_02815 [Alphaproteobacteria bacterium]|jgi:hypothetical protein|nr:hypothetical protein [Alphaproteobacteria bacterium]
MAENQDVSVLSRRKALARLGLVAAVAYAAPTITHIDGEALAKKKARPSVICPGGSCGSKSKSKSRGKSSSRGSGSRGGSKSRGSSS